MNQISGNSTSATYQGYIPPSNNITRVYYYIEVYDLAYNNNTSQTFNYTTNTPPVITNLTHTPKYPNANVTVSANIKDDGMVTSALLYYAFANFTAQDVYDISTWNSSSTYISYYPRSIAIEDMDNDSDLDIVVVSYRNYIYIFENPGNNTSINNWTYYSKYIYGYFYSIDIADLDGDGDKDIIFGDSYGRVYVLTNPGSLNLNTWNYSYNTVSDDAYAVKADDMDSDGDIDVVVGDHDGKVYIFENNGSTINNWTSYNKYTGASYIYSIDIADLDGDGDKDIITGDSNYRVNVLNNPGSLDVSAWQLSYNTIYNYPYSIATYDMDNDGDQDIVVGDSYRYIYMFENPGNINLNTWTRYSRYEYSMSRVYSIQTADLDQDGYQDLVSSDYSYRKVHLFYNNRNLSISTWNSSTVYTSGYVYTVAVGDLDNDTDKDLIAGDTYGYLYLLENPLQELEWNSTAMSNISDIYSGVIPSPNSTKLAYYYISAEDNYGYTTNSSIYSYIVDAEPPYFGNLTIEPQYPNATTSVRVS
ncbi:MAG TPA: VCBS repeat-containing protein, partial [Archaeoglobaceae archaeon]|nr:VCBS repeat-containing protein [Archaeoglobaceae archaeon]